MAREWSLGFSLSIHAEPRRSEVRMDKAKGAMNSKVSKVHGTNSLRSMAVAEIWQIFLEAVRL